MSGFRSRNAATQEQIDKAEHELEVSFANDYREYLAEFGCASVYGHEFTGICRAPRLNVVEITKEQRQLNKSIPSNWYVIEQGNIDDIVIWQNEVGEIFETSPGNLGIKIANNFLEYIAD